MEASNMKAMREALEFADRKLRMATEDDRYGDDLVYLVGCMRCVAEVCRAALSKPPRNCDLYAHDEALEAWVVENENERYGCFDEWLYHVAEEQKGETDGSK